MLTPLILAGLLAQEPPTDIQNQREIEHIQRRFFDEKMGADVERLLAASEGQIWLSVFHNNSWNMRGGFCGTGISPDYHEELKPGEASDRAKAYLKEMWRMAGQTRKVEFAHNWLGIYGFEGKPHAKYEWEVGVTEGPGARNITTIAIYDMRFADK